MFVPTTTTQKTPTTPTEIRTVRPVDHDNRTAESAYRIFGHDIGAEFVGEQIWYRGAWETITEIGQIGADYSMATFQGSRNDYRIDHSARLYLRT